MINVKFVTRVGRIGCTTKVGNSPKNKLWIWIYKDITLPEIPRKSDYVKVGRGAYEVNRMLMIENKNHVLVVSYSSTNLNHKKSTEEEVRKVLKGFKERGWSEFDEEHLDEYRKYLFL